MQITGLSFSLYWTFVIEAQDGFNKVRSYFLFFLLFVTSLVGIFMFTNWQLAVLDKYWRNKFLVSIFLMLGPPIVQFLFLVPAVRSSQMVTSNSNRWWRLWWEAMQPNSYHLCFSKKKLSFMYSMLSKHFKNVYIPLQLVEMAFHAIGLIFMKLRYCT